MCNDVCKQEVSVFSNQGKYIQASELDREKGKTKLYCILVNGNKLCFPKV